MAESDRYVAIASSFDDAFKGFLQLGSWQQAVQAKAQSADWAWKNERRARSFDGRTVRQREQLQVDPRCLHVAVLGSELPRPKG